MYWILTCMYQLFTTYRYHDRLHMYQKLRRLLTCASAHITGEVTKGEHSVLSEGATLLIGCTVEADSLDSRIFGTLWMIVDDDSR